MYTSGICTEVRNACICTTKTFYVPSLGMKIIKEFYYLVHNTTAHVYQSMCRCGVHTYIHTVHQLEGNTHRHSSLAPELGGQDQSLVIDRGRDPQDGGVRLTHAVVTVGL